MVGNSAYSSLQRWGVMAMAIVSSVSTVASSTIINVAIPDIMGALGISPVDAQWLSAGFLAAMTASMVLVDYASKAYGQRQVMVVALAAFVVSSTVGAITSDATTLIVMRLVQGAAAGIVQPLCMIAIFQVYPPERRGTAMGIFGVGVVMAPALGPYLGGVMVEAWNWRSVFIVTIPMGAIGMALSLPFMPAGSYKGERPSFDWPAFALLVAFLVLGLTAFADGPELGWDDTSITARFGLCVLFAFLFVAREVYASEPLVDVRVFLSPAFTGASLVGVALGAGLFGSTYLLPLFVQTVQGLTPMQAGAIILPAGLSMIFLTPLTGRLADRINPGIQVCFGLVLFTVSFFLMSMADVRTSAVTLALWIMISRIGMGFIFPAINAGGVRALPPDLLAQGAASMNFVRQLSGAFGVNIIAVVLADRTQAFNAQIISSLDPTSDVSARYIEQLSSMTIPLNLSEAESYGVGVAHLGEAINTQAAVMAYSVAWNGFAVAFSLSLIGGLMMYFGGKSPRATVAA